MVGAFAIALAKGSTVALAGGAVALYAYGMRLQRTPAPPIDPAKIERDGGKYVKAADGRIIEYFVCGSSKQNAKVVVSCAGGGFTGRMHVAHPEMARKFAEMNVKSIAVSGPGQGYTTNEIDRRIVTWPATDLAPVLEAEGVDKFAIDGVSLGSPHALSAANHFGTRVTTLGISLPYLPRAVSDELGLPLGQNPPFSNADFGTFDAQWWAPFCYAMMSLFMSRPGDNVFTKPSWILAKFSETLLGAAKAKEMRGIQDFVKREPATSSYMAAELNRGAVNSYRFYVESTVGRTLLDWNFDPRTIPLPPKVVVFYAEDDSDCPPSHGKFYTDHFREQCAKEGKTFVSKTLSGYGHMSGIIELMAFEEAVGA